MTSVGRQIRLRVIDWCLKEETRLGIAVQLQYPDIGGGPTFFLENDGLSVRCPPRMTVITRRLKNT